MSSYVAICGPLPQPPHIDAIAILLHLSGDQVSDAVEWSFCSVTVRIHTSIGKETVLLSGFSILPLPCRTIDTAHPARCCDRVLSYLKSSRPIVTPSLPPAGVPPTPSHFPAPTLNTLTVFLFFMFISDPPQNPEITVTVNNISGETHSSESCQTFLFLLPENLGCPSPIHAFREFRNEPPGQSVTAYVSWSENGEHAVRHL